MFVPAEAKMSKKIISASVAAAMILTMVSGTGCNMLGDAVTGTTPVSTSGSQTETSKSETTTSATTESSQESETGFNLSWSNFDSKQLDMNIQKKFNGQTLASYISLFGFTDELNKMFTDCANDLYGTDYESIPFSEVNYFKLYITDVSATGLIGAYSSSYEIFCSNYLDSQYIYTDPFNEVLMSYLISKKIPFGSTIPIEDLKAFYGDNVYQGKDTGYPDYIAKKGLPGSKKDSYKYSKDELLYILLNYNDAMSTLTMAEGIYSRDFFDTNPEYADRTALVKKLINEHLKKFYGDAAWQLGEVPTEEQYNKIFGKAPMDLSYVVTP